MRIAQACWTAADGWSPNLPMDMGEAELAFVFASREILENDRLVDELKVAIPKSVLFGCSTAGEILDTRVRDNSASVTVVKFEDTGVRCASLEIADSVDSFEAGRQLAGSIPHEGLVHLLVLSDGIVINGSELVRGLSSSLPEGVSITGGLSGDGARFERTVVLNASGAPARAVSVVGLYGARLRVGYASLGGWDAFGPERLVTHSQGNVLYELDGMSALDLYKRYLGEHADGLPATGLLFPLSLRRDEADTPVVRTILGVDEENHSLTFAGDVPEGSFARLMMANFDRLIDGASGAAQRTRASVQEPRPELALLISCVGRKMVLKQRIEEEVEAVREVLPDAALTGFYSYGEISPFTPNAKCELHNQTMTITTFAEVDA